MSGQQFWTVYRFYDADGDLVYVGFTCNPGGRFGNHKTSDMWAEVAHITLSHYKTAERASAAELRAIAMEEPKYNVAGVPTTRADQVGASRSSSIRTSVAQIRRVRVAPYVAGVCGQLFAIWPAGERRVWISDLAAALHERPEYANWSVEDFSMLFRLAGLRTVQTRGRVNHQLRNRNGIALSDVLDTLQKQASAV